VHFVAQFDDPTAGLYRCNCSLCRKKGIVMKAISDSAFEVLQGQAVLSRYKWNKQIAEHYFCSVCGVYTHHRRRRDPTQISVNVECIEGLQMPDPTIIGLVNGLEHD
jgi:hypothetical protein